MSVFQNIKTKRVGLRCPIRVMNKSGDDLLTTYAPEVDNSVEVATEDLRNFWDSCIAEFGNSTLKPMLAGRRTGHADFDWIGGDVMDPEFDLSLYEEVLIQPVPLSGG